MKRPDLTNVNIATLKAQLAKYLRLVRAGRELIITDHREPIARIVPFEPMGTLETIKPKRAFSEVVKQSISPVKGHTIDSLAFLLEERQKR